MNAQDQNLKGTIAVESISLEILLKNSANTGATNETGDSGNVTLVLDEASTWTLSADSYISSFTGNPQNIIDNGFAINANGVALNGTK